MRITSKEVARLANVSRSTVSRVINNYSNVPEETRQKVMEVIKKYDYHPNSSARTLAGKANPVIALFIYDDFSGQKHWRGIKSTHEVRLIAELVSQCKEYGYSLSVSIVSEPADYLKIEDMYLNREISSGIFIGFEFQMDRVNTLIAKDFPMIVVDPGDGMLEPENVHAIYTENVKAGYLATAYLLEHGHLHIAHIAGDERKSSVERIRGYRQALMERGIPKTDLQIREGGFESEKAYAITKEFLRDSSITAIFAANDVMALAAIRAIRDSGRQVPEDIAVVGCDYNETFQMAGYNLTTIELSIYEEAKACVEITAGIEKGKKISCKAIFKQGDTA